MPPTLRNVFRLDSLPLNQTYYTAEGYLVDRPIVTSTGIFEYLNPDGTVRRELRLPEDVFDPESLKSYKGKPVIITHDAGLINKDNVGEEEIGTILSEGYRSGNDVRAEIVIHDTDKMKSAGFKELSLGYNLDLDKTPGTWQGQHYDAIQRNIRINHLALVREARAGEQARLNIDSRDNKPKGETNMRKTKRTSHGDGVLSPDELKKAVEEYKARRAQRLSKKQEDGDDVENAPVKSAEPAVPNTDGDDQEVTIEATEDGDVTDLEAKTQKVKANRDRRDSEGDPKDKEAAMGVIAQQDEDMGILFDIIDTLLAEKDFGDTNHDGDEPVPTEPTEGTTTETDGDDEECVGGTCTDGDDVEPAEIPVGGKMNADSVDRIVRQRVRLGMIGQKLNMDGLENVGILAAKKAVIKAVRPGVRLDGKSTAYVDAAFDLACAEVERSATKDTAYQKKQMFNADSAKQIVHETSATAARDRMIERHTKRKKKEEN